MPRPSFRSFAPTDRPACLHLFDANCPRFFAPNERVDYEAFMDEKRGGYEVCLLDDQVVGGYGVLVEGPTGLALRWILIAPDRQGLGIGTAIMRRVLDQVKAHGPDARLHIGASHLSAPFFGRFGARELARYPNGWGPDMHRVDMELIP
ncbi:MAG TPA: GNAT family N-acetyltransferase [Gemmatimonadales bacterium]|nr:GNAT family N-acetyltransferase [Gemmatimonadales bacterium]